MNTRKPFRPSRVIDIDLIPDEELEDFNSTTCEFLRAELGARDLNSKGSKVALWVRLIDALDEEENAGEATPMKVNRWDAWDEERGGKAHEERAGLKTRLRKRTEDARKSEAEKARAREAEEKKRKSKEAARNEEAARMDEVIEKAFKERDLRKTRARKEKDVEEVGEEDDYEDVQVSRMTYEEIKQLDLGTLEIAEQDFKRLPDALKRRVQRHYLRQLRSLQENGEIHPGQSKVTTCPVTGSILTPDYNANDIWASDSEGETALPRRPTKRVRGGADDGVDEANKRRRVNKKEIQGAVADPKEKERQAKAKTVVPTDYMIPDAFLELEIGDYRVKECLDQTWTKLGVKPNPKSTLRAFLRENPDIRLELALLRKSDPTLLPEDLYASHMLASGFADRPFMDVLDETPVIYQIWERTMHECSDLDDLWQRDGDRRGEHRVFTPFLVADMTFGDVLSVYRHFGELVGSLVGAEGGLIIEVDGQESCFIGGSELLLVDDESELE